MHVHVNQISQQGAVLHTFPSGVYVYTEDLWCFSGNIARVLPKRSVMWGRMSLWYCYHVTVYEKLKVTERDFKMDKCKCHSRIWCDREFKVRVSGIRSEPLSYLHCRWRGLTIKWDRKLLWVQCLQMTFRSTVNVGLSELFWKGRTTLETRHLQEQWSIIFITLNWSQVLFP